jgi:hypothetical protein
VCIVVRLSRIVKNNLIKHICYSLVLAGLFVLCSPAGTFAQCGGERNPVKIGTDQDVGSVNLNNSPTATTIANLIAIAAPKKLQDTRRIQPTETTVYVINGILKKYMRMYDSDYHMVIADSSGRTMIAEIPSPSCVPSNSRFAAGIAHARAQFDAMFTATNGFQNADVPVRITGVGFFDYLEGQAGQAGNGIELHPVIDITFDSHFSLSSSPSSLTISQGASGTSTVTSVQSGSFNSSVALSVSGLPAGATADFSPSSISAPGGGSPLLTISAGPTTPGGTYNVVVTGSGGGESHTTTINLTVLSGGGSAQQLLGNPGFENGSGSTAPWNASTAVIDNSSAEAPRTGSWKAWLDGYGTTHTDTLWQQVSIPAATQATLSFWLHIDTFETSNAAANDTLKVQVRDSSGLVLATLATYSNLNAAAGYAQVVFDLTPYRGQTVQVYLVGIENGSLKSSFVVDDFALMAVTSGGPGDFGISASPAAVTLAVNSSGGSNITSTISGSFNSSIALSVAGLPAGTSAGFSPTAMSAPGAGTSALTFSVGASTATGTYNLVVTGDGGGQTHSTPITLNVTAGGGGGTTQQLLGNAGFENGATNSAPWTATASVIDSNSTSEPAHSGSWKAWLNGYGSAHTDTLLQSASIPSAATSASLSFWLHIDTTETTTTRAYDTLAVQVRNSSGTVLATLATYSNLNAASGYAKFSFDLSAYRGQTIQLYLIGVEDTSLKTSFVVDDFALNVTTP